MHLVRYAERADAVPRVGVRDGSGVRRLAVESLADLLARPLAEIRSVVVSTSGSAIDPEETVLLPPVDGRMEVWAAGVTYARSREARMEESSVADVYERVYGAERPELFFKAVPWRVVTDDEPIAIRRDSELNVPEAELAVVLNSVGETIGFTVCNDVSSRTIEGENPLYLPQAKVYAGSCALSSAIRPAWELDGGNLEITLEVRRDREIAWSGRVSTGQLRRTPAELSAFLFEEEQFPDGVILSTGTGIVPEMEFTLAVGDVVSITVDQVGTLSNHVVAGKGELAWLAVTKGGLRRAPLAPS
jgi:2-dehydro-3-deoxy-D-arabinonate dehydratase